MTLLLYNWRVGISNTCSKSVWSRLLKPMLLLLEVCGLGHSQGAASQVAFTTPTLAARGLLVEDDSPCSNDVHRWLALLYYKCLVATFITTPCPFTKAELSSHKDSQVREIFLFNFLTSIVSVVFSLKSFFFVKS